MGKPVLLGMLDRPVPKNRHVYAKYQIGPQQKSVFVKLPNIEKMKTIIMARKLLYMNYVYGEHKNKLTQFADAEDWDENLQERLSRAGQYKFGYKTRRLRKPEKGSNPLNQNIGTDIADGVEVSTTIGDVIPSNRIPSISETNALPADKEISVFESEEWQRRRFPQRMKIDACSNEVVEILTNIRMTALNSKDITCKASREVIYTETMRDAIYLHDWARVAKCAQGLSLEASTQHRHWMIWHGGFLAHIQISKNDIQSLVEFAQGAKVLLKGYPTRFGIDLATWFTQKGHFTHGLCLLEEFHSMSSNSNIWSYCTLANNPKRNMIDLVGIFYSAVFQYLSFKRDLQLYEDDKYTGDEDSLTRSGEKALTMFESVLELSEKTEKDVTIFIEPLIELVWRFRGDDRAKEIFENICTKNFKNGILENLYITFLRDHFPHLEQEIREREARLARFNFDVDATEKSLDECRVRKFVKKSTAGSSIKFKKLENPGFSW